nr:MAG: capsid protein [Cressdnaviricota sp.]
MARRFRKRRVKIRIRRVRRKFSRNRRAKKKQRLSRWRVKRYQPDVATAKLTFEQSFRLQLTNGALPSGTTPQGFAVAGNAAQPTLQALNGAVITSSAPRTTPVGWVVLSETYGQYKVYGSKQKITLMNTDIGSANNTNIWWMAGPAPSGQTASELYQPDIIASYPYWKKRIVQYTPNSTTKMYTMKHYVSTRKIEGIARAEMEDTDYSAPTTAASPTKIWYHYNLFNNFINTNLTANQFYDVHLSWTGYYKFYRRTLNPSVQ